MEQDIDINLIHISELSSSKSLDREDLLLISKHDETIDKNYVSMKSTVGQLESDLSTIIKNDISVDEINRKINILQNFCNQLSSYRISADITNPYVISSMDFKDGVIASVGGYELSTAMDITFKNTKYDKINVETLKSDNLSTNNAKIENLEIDGHGDIVDFINSSIEHMAAFYVTKDEAGNAFETFDQLSNLTKSKDLYIGGIKRMPLSNDYCVVLSDETIYERYPGSYDISAVYTTRYSWVTDPSIEDLSGKWEFKYVINNSPYTAIQWKTINSGVTKEWKETTDTNVRNTKERVDEINGRQEDWTFVLENGTPITKTVYCYNKQQ